MIRREREEKKGILCRSETTQASTPRHTPYITVSTHTLAQNSSQRVVSITIALSSDALAICKFVCYFGVILT